MKKNIFPLLFFVLCSCAWDNYEQDSDYLPFDDSEYPYSNIPRLIVETNNFAQIRDCETKVYGKSQFFGEKAPLTEVLDLSIKGRGNSSFTGMPKPSYAVELTKKQSLLGMPEDKDWALIANSADKTLLKNHITYRLAKWLGDEYSPRSQFVELYLNRQYQGVYLLTETVKIAKDRINIPKTSNSYLLEKGPTDRGNEIFITTKNGTTFSLKHPKNPDQATQKDILVFLNQLENFLTNGDSSKKITDYIDFDDYLRYYWIQELSKNLDGAFRRSIFLTKQNNGPIQMGPVWDFDVAYGNWIVDSLRTPIGWYVRPSGWNGLIFRQNEYLQEAKKYWKEHRDFLATLPDSIRKYSQEIAPAARNEFKRWPVLENTENWTYKEPYQNYSEAIDSLNSWIRQRIEWIDRNI